MADTIETDQAKLAADQAERDRKAAEAKAAKAAKDDPKRAEAQKKYDDAQAEAVKLQQEAAEAHAKAEQKAKTPEQVAAEEADKKADDARAKAAALHPDANPPEGNTSITDAGVMLPHSADPEMSAGHVNAVKRSNDPSNPAYAPGIPTHDEAQTVRLSRITRDSPMPVYAMVHPDMVGDYLRAGWSKS